MDATAAIGPGGPNVIETTLDQGAPADGPELVVVVNKIDRPGREAVAAQLLEVSRAVEEVAIEIGTRRRRRARGVLPGLGQDR